MDFKALKPSQLSLCVIAIILVVANLFAFSVVAKNSNASDTAVTSDSQVSGGVTTTPTVLSGADVSVQPSESTTTTETREEVVLDLPYYIEIDKVRQVVTVYTTNEEGKYEKLVRQMICSTGQKIDKFPDGVYPLKEDRHLWLPMASNGPNKLYAQYTVQISGDFLFHSVPYTKNRNNASLSVSRYLELGQAVSGGCIRLTVEGAKWIYENCPAGTPVRVLKGDAFDAELVESLRPAEPEGGWDPTDPDPRNPNYRPLITTPDPEPDKYAPLYDYQWKWAKEVPYITRATTTESTESTESTDSADGEGTDTAPSDTPADPGETETTTAAPAAPSATEPTVPTTAPTPSETPNE